MSSVKHKLNEGCHKKQKGSKLSKQTGKGAVA
jgi:hypothetical protein